MKPKEQTFIRLIKKVEPISEMLWFKKEQKSEIFNEVKKITFTNVSNHR
jgi:hypothetical protein